jgi:lipopolysaccharide transport system permease protein
MKKESQTPIRVYQRNNSLSFFTLLEQSIKDLYNSNFLAKQLAKRDISAQYRQSFLGIIWIFITPLVTSLVWIVLNSSGTVQVLDTGVPYPIYAFSGTLIWSILLESINAPISDTNGAKGMMAKINFSKEAIILSSVYKILFNSSVKLILVILFVFIYGLGLHWSLLLFPVAVVFLIIFGVTLGLIMTPIGLLYNDIGKFIGMGLSFVMYLTPVVYTIPKEGLLKTVMELNPLTPLLLTARDFALGNTPEFLPYFLIVMLVTIPVFFVALMFYRMSIPVLIERSNS